MEEIKESRGGNQVDEKKGKTYTRRSSTGKKKGRKACESCKDGKVLREIPRKDKEVRRELSRIYHSLLSHGGL